LPTNKLTACRIEYFHYISSAPFVPAAFCRLSPRESTPFRRAKGDKQANLAPRRRHPSFPSVRCWTFNVRRSASPASPPRACIPLRATPK
jgi:hypothetical protein